MRTIAPALVAGLTLAACGSGAPGGGDEPVPTYHQDIKPIVDAKCAGCHAEAGIAPFGLEDYAQVEGNAELALHAIESGAMPPWPPNPECNDYVADRSLTDDEKALFAAWVEGGAPEGDPASPAPPLDLERVELTRVDVRLEMEREYTPQTTDREPDEYRCFVLPLPADMTSTKYVTGFRAVPGNDQVVHHVIAFYAEPDLLDDYLALDAGEEGDGYTCFGGPGGPSRGGMLGAWAPGSLGSDFPAGTGLPVAPGSAVIMQVHYNGFAAGAQPDLTAIELKLDDTVEKPAIIQPWANPSWLGGGMPIPAGDPDVTHSFQYDASSFLGGEFTLYSAALHQHELGVRSKATIERAAGGSTCLLQIDDWDFHWQGSYGFRDPVHFESGDQLKVECTWDNSPENQRVVDGQQLPPQDVNWGEGTGDEMCIGFFYIVVD